MLDACDDPLIEFVFQLEPFGFVLGVVVNGMSDEHHRHFAFELVDGGGEVPKGRRIHYDDPHTAFADFGLVVTKGIFRCGTFDIRGMIKITGNRVTMQHS